MPSQTDQDSAA